MFQKIRKLKVVFEAACRLGVTHLYTAPSGVVMLAHWLMAKRPKFELLVRCRIFEEYQYKPALLIVTFRLALNSGIIISRRARKLHYRVHKSSLLVPILNQKNSVHATSHFHSHIIPSVPRSSKWPLSLGFPTKPCMCTILPYVLHVPSISST